MIRWDVLCPECGYQQVYHSYNSEVKGKRRKSCEKCGKSFLAWRYKLSNLGREMKKKLLMKRDSKPDGFFKFSKSS